MQGFRDRADLEDVLQLLDARLVPLEACTVDAWAATGRVLAHDEHAPWDLPPFPRSAMDGYAVKGGDTFGASPYNPLPFRVVGVSLPGQPHRGHVQSGEAVRIMTGAPLPAGADAVVMAEDTTCAGSELQVTAPVTPGRHVGQQGEDVAAGAVLLAAGTLLRPQETGLLCTAGQARVQVIRRPRVGLLVTGSEIIPPGGEIRPHAILDASSPMLRGLVAQDGGEALPPLWRSDEPAALRESLTQLAATCDAVLTTGGSSVGQEDHVPLLVAELGELAVHGIAMRPAGPAGVGFLGQVPVFLLPGNPVSALAAYELVAGPALRRLGGRPMAWPHHQVQAPLRRKIASAVGRVDYVRVRLQEGEVEPIATSGASILTSATRADGVVLVERDSEGLPPGALATVHLYRGRT
jgi:molybdopterin molybdotransferase